MRAVQFMFVVGLVLALFFGACYTLAFFQLRAEFALLRAAVEEHHDQLQQLQERYDVAVAYTNALRAEVAGLNSRPLPAAQEEADAR